MECRTAQPCGCQTENLLGKSASVLALCPKVRPVQVPASGSSSRAWSGEGSVSRPVGRLRKDRQADRE